MGGSSHLGEYGNKVYYQNYENHIAVYDLRTKDTLVYEEVNLRSDSSIKNSAQYCICGKYCYYTNILDNDYIYRYDFETGENKRMVSETITRFGILANEQYLYYNSKGHTLYRMDVNTFTKEKLMENVNGRISLSVDGSALYVQSSEETEVWEKIN